MSILSEIERLSKRNGLDRVGATLLKKPFSIEHYRNWLNKGFQGEMEYLEAHLAQKENPQLLGPNLRSALVVAEPYRPHPFPQKSPLRTALYAQGADYHSWLKTKLEVLAQDLRAHFPKDEFLCFTDSAPVLERDLAYMAGLGWVGKNTCVIHPKFGSLWFIGEIYTSLELEITTSQMPDFCGTCDRCLRACPTQALVEPRVLDATKCISYWTIEAKSVAPENLRSRFGDWFFGCDICQTVCPWNEKVFEAETMRALSAPTLSVDAQTIAELRFILRSSHHQLMKHFQDSPLSRARGRGLKRNALIVIANLRLQELKEDVAQMKTDHPDLKELITWTLGYL